MLISLVLTVTMTAMVMPKKKKKKKMMIMSASPPPAFSAALPSQHALVRDLCLQKQ
jgi:hypothetical protein